MNFQEPFRRKLFINWSRTQSLSCMQQRLCSADALYLGFGQSFVCAFNQIVLSWSQYSTYNTIWYNLASV